MRHLGWPHTIVPAIPESHLNTEMVAQRWSVTRSCALKRLRRLNVQPLRTSASKTLWWNPDDIAWDHDFEPLIYGPNRSTNDGIGHNLEPWPMLPHPGMGWNNGWSMFMPARPSSRRLEIAK